jgi:hypothetical protein
VDDICKADMVIVPADIIEQGQGAKRPYTEQLSKKAKAGPIPPAPARKSTQLDHFQKFIYNLTHFFLAPSFQAILKERLLLLKVCSSQHVYPIDDPTHFLLNSFLFNSAPF